MVGCVQSVRCQRLSTDHLRAIDIVSTIPIVSMEKSAALTRILINNQTDIDYEAADRDLLHAGEELKQD